MASMIRYKIFYNNELSAESYISGKNRARYLYLSPKPKKLKYKYRESLTDQVKSEIDMLN